MKPTSETKIIKTPDYTIHFYIDYFNKRLRVDDYRGNVNMIVQKLNKAMDDYKFTKLIYFSRVEHWRQLLSIGFELEGIVNGYFNGSDNYIMTCYKENERRTSTSWLQEDVIIQSIQEKGKRSDESKLPGQYSIRKAETEDAVKLADLYNNVFPIYPTPMNNPEYVTKVMITGGTIFYVVECNNELVSAASAEIHTSLHNAEITDCATLPEHRKYGLLKRLMVELEKELKDAGIYCAFSLARALSYGMNAALFQLGYQYNGRLTNNCFIFDKIENMNVWVKDLSS